MKKTDLRSYHDKQNRKWPILWNTKMLVMQSQSAESNGFVETWTKIQQQTKEHFNISTKKVGKTIQIIEYAVRAPSNLDCTPTKALCRSLIWLLLLLLLLFWWVGVCCLADGIPKIKLNKMCFDVSMFESEKVENDWLSGLARLKFILVDCF